MITKDSRNIKISSEDFHVFSPLEARTMSEANDPKAAASVAKAKPPMAFLSARIKADRPSPKSLEKARRLPPFLIRVF